MLINQDIKTSRVNIIEIKKPETLFYEQFKEQKIELAPCINKKFNLHVHLRPQ